MSHTPTAPDREAVTARGREGQKATSSTEEGGGASEEEGLSELLVDGASST